MTGWIAVQRYVRMNYDLENSPLQIRTNSEIGSDEEVRVYFDDVHDNLAGGVFLSFSSSIESVLFLCTDWTDFPTTLPPETDKVWTITLTRSSGTPTIVIHCNNKEVLKVVLSNSACSYSDWRQYWSKEMEKILFSSQDTASDYYRPGKVMVALRYTAHIRLLPTR